jgi:hypothetical protein
MRSVLFGDVDRLDAVGKVGAPDQQSPLTTQVGLPFVQGTSSVDGRDEGTDRGVGRE